jgi:hypothetical protein
MKVALLHGIGQRFLGDEQIVSQWLPALNGGLHEAGYRAVTPEDCGAVFYGAIFRPSGKRGEESPSSSIAHEDEWLAEMLVALQAEAAARSEVNRVAADPKGENPTIRPPGDDAATRARTPHTMQAVLRELSKSRFISKLGPQRFLLGDLREVRMFLLDGAIKASVLERCERVVGPDTRVLVAHSLGSVVGYELLCRHPDWRIDTFVTIGSPLGIRSLVFDALTPRPEGGKGRFPNVGRWINIADMGDIVALQKQLAPFFGPVEDVLVYNGWESHSATRYLTARETGEAIGAALAR